MKISLKAGALAAGLCAALLAGAWYGMPQLFKAPLVNLNRSLSDLEEHQVRAAGHNIHYLAGGSGEPVVLLHGIFAEKDHWVDYARALTPSYRVIAPDLPGYGESGRLAHASYRYHDQVERLAAFLDALGVQRAHLAGSSMGGTIAALFAERYPQRVLSVAFIGAPHGIRTPRESAMDAAIARGEAPLVARDAQAFERMMALLFARMPFLPYPILQDAQQQAVAQAPDNLRLWQQQLENRYLLDERLGRWNAPTLALWGEEDRLFDVSGARALEQRMPTVRVETLAGLGHLPMMEAPASTAGRHLIFLKSLGAP